MGTVNVADVLSDPDFVQPLILVKRTPVVDNYGQNQLQEVGCPIVGSVQPASGKVLQRIPEAFRVANVMSFWVKQKLINDYRGKYPDIIVKSGIRFAVQIIFDWSDWGEGWTEGTCVAEKPNG